MKSTWYLAVQVPNALNLPGTQMHSLAKRRPQKTMYLRCIFYVRCSLSMYVCECVYVTKRISVFVESKIDCQAQIACMLV